MTATATWVTEQVTITGLDGRPSDVQGWILSDHPELAITRHAHTWGVTHIASGWSCAMWFATRGAAEALLLAIAPLADWSQDATELRKLEQLSADVWRIRAEIFAREERGDFGPIDSNDITEWNTLGRLEESQPTRELGVHARRFQRT